MLQGMQQPTPSQSSSFLSSFAGMLAALASPAPSAPSDAADDAPLWNSNDLGDDVASLSYERALRTHGRYRAANRDLDRDSDRGDGSLTRADDPGTGVRADTLVKNSGAGAIGGAGAADCAGANIAAGAAVRVDAAPGLQMGSARENNLRSASVTIRLSAAECTRLHQRAAEAGLTVSAYLRSCAVEAEGLRAQVKQALVELKAESKLPRQAQAACPTAARSLQGTSDRGGKKSAQQRFYGWIRWLTRRG
jgi:hypothetical protein